MDIPLLLDQAAGTVPVTEGVARVHAVLDEVDTDAVGPVSGRDVAEVDRAIARMEALKLRLVAAADQQDAGARAGMSGTSAWLAAHTRSWGGKAAADVSLATALEESLPVTKQALADGQLSTAHASVIAGTTSRLPETLTDEERTKIETALVAQAKHVDPARLRRSGRRALLAAERSAAEALAHEDTELRGEEARAEARVRLTMHDNHDGTVSGHFTVPALAGAILRKTIQQMASPRRRALGSAGAEGSLEGSECSPGTKGGAGTASGARDGRHTIDGRRRELVAAGGGGEPAPGGGGGEPAPGGGGDAQPAPSGGGELAPGGGAGELAPGGRGDGSRDADWAQRYGQAFVELLEHLPTDRLNGKVAATVVVTIDHDRLRDNLGAAHLDTGHDLSASETRRLACSAGILPAILGGSSLPLDLGRSNRFFSEAQRVALATTYDECAAEGCDRPYAWSELHHEDPWSRGGATDLDRAVPLCRFHHRRAHDPTYAHFVDSDGAGRKSVTFRRLS
jgi:hypothetical protein